MERRCLRDEEIRAMLLKVKIDEGKSGGSD